MQRWGELSPDRDNVVVVLHALTGDSHITGPAGPDHPTPGWWDGVAGPGAPIDTDRWCAVATNVLGGCRGSTGPEFACAATESRGAHGFPLITVRDQVDADVAALAALGITEVAAVVGGSMGGARALEWIVGHPDTRPGGAGSGGRGTCDRRPDRHAEHARSRPSSPTRTGSGGDYYGTGRSPDVGMEIARRFAHLTYRGEAELDDRFGNDAPGRRGSRRPAAATRCRATWSIRAASWLTRFDAGTYVALTEALSQPRRRPRPRRRARRRCAGCHGPGDRRRHHLRPAVPAAAAGGTGRPAAGLCRS